MTNYKKYPLILFILIILILQNSCDSYTIHIKYNYYIEATDIIEQSNISFKDNTGYTFIVPAAVFAAGANKNFIIAKQHPCKPGDTPNKKITNYYIIPLKNKISEKPVENKIGPLTKSEFEFQRKKLGISADLDFTIIIKDLE